MELRPGKAPRFVVFGAFFMFGDDMNVDDMIGSAHSFSDGSSDNCMSGEEEMEATTPVRRIAVYDDMLTMLEAFREEMQLRADSVPNPPKHASSYKGWVFTEMGHTYTT
ncbi:hypothetical protein TrVE_jg12132 [Triparma verrucosa]|uniref:Uncharacterized protein n=1 Tax=Triparma verrucosa TaxID=1606542 RepID=A0A9W7CA32_9STRA|nr:hypothetical protein TrVE_jg12132 [Triparma verrucosa]